MSTTFSATCVGRSKLSTGLEARDGNPGWRRRGFSFTSHLLDLAADLVCLASGKTNATVAGRTKVKRKRNANAVCRPSDNTIITSRAVAGQTLAARRRSESACALDIARLIGQQSRRGRRRTDGDNQRRCRPRVQLFRWEMRFVLGKKCKSVR